MKPAAAIIASAVSQSAEAASDWLARFSAFVDRIDGFVWGIADSFNGLMAFPNLVALVLLSPVVWRVTKDYLDRSAGSRF